MHVAIPSCPGTTHDAIGAASEYRYHQYQVLQQKERAALPQ
jgi:hypothetical protein